MIWFWKNFTNTLYTLTIVENYMKLLSTYVDIPNLIWHLSVIPISLYDLYMTLLYMSLGLIWHNMQIGIVSNRCSIYVTRHGIVGSTHWVMVDTKLLTQKHCYVLSYEYCDQGTNDLNMAKYVVFRCVNGLGVFQMTANTRHFEKRPVFPVFF